MKIEPINFVQKSEEWEQVQLEEELSYFDRCLAKATNNPEAFIQDTVEYISELNAMLDGKKKYKEQVTNSIKKYEEKIERQKNVCNYILMGLNKKKLEGAAGSVSFRKSTQVVLSDETAIPEDYTTFVETKKIDKVAIKEDLKQGKEVKGAYLAEKQNIHVSG